MTHNPYDQFLEGLKMQEGRKGNWYKTDGAKKLRRTNEIDLIPRTSLTQRLHDYLATLRFPFQIEAK